MPTTRGYGKRAIARSFYDLYQSNRTGKRKNNPRKRDQIIAIALAIARRNAKKAGDKKAVAKLTKSLQDLRTIMEPRLVVFI